MGVTQTSAKKLATRAYSTYLARLRMSKRLQAMANWWNAAQFTLSTALVTVAIVFLGFPSANTKFLQVFLVALSVLALVVSLTVTYLDFAGRAQKTVMNYRALQAFSVRTESIVDSHRRIQTSALRDLQDEYDRLLDSSENHSHSDHFLSSVEPGKQRTKVIWARSYPVILPFFATIGSVIGVIFVFMQLP